MAARRKAKKRGSKPQAMQYENLESRQLMAAGIFYDAVSDAVSIYGNGANDNATVKQISGGRVSVTTWDGASRNDRTIDSPVKSIVFVGSDGNDYFRNYTAIPSFAYGGTGRDTLVGGSGADVLSGNTGIDRIWGEGEEMIRSMAEARTTIWSAVVATTKCCLRRG